jgi:hypothetical protein
MPVTEPHADLEDLRAGGGCRTSEIDASEAAGGNVVDLLAGSGAEGLTQDEIGRVAEAFDVRSPWA